MLRKIVKTEVCPNCGAQQGDANFCPNCGQKNNSHKPNFFEYIRDAVENLFAFDTKFYRSLIPLLWKPGKLTQYFNEGKKASYVLPIRLFILITILLLAVVGCQERFDKENWYDIDAPEKGQPAMMSDTTALKASELLADSTAASTAILDSMETHGIIEWDEENQRYISSAQKRGFAVNSDIEILEKYIEFATKNPDLSVDTALARMNEERSFYHLLVYSNCLKLVRMESGELSRYMRRNILYILLLHIPVIAFLLKLVFINKRIHYVDHFVFGLHVQTAIFAYALIASILHWTTGFNIFWWLYGVGMFVYLFIALKRYYRESRILTTLKFILLNTLMLVVTLIFILLVTSVSVILY